MPSVQDQRLFHRAAGPAGAGRVRRHGFPASSFMFRDLNSRLA
jgi:hypothetical protein